jgi:uncharacterized protein YeaO (DUF488 family)
MAVPDTDGMSGRYLVKRAYDPPAAKDGNRVLVDRLWPRGVSKEHAELDAWAKDATPSAELREWYHADREQYDEFARRYEVELDGDAQQKALDEIRALAENSDVTLITAAKDIEHSHVPVLRRRLAETAD